MNRKQRRVKAKYNIAGNVIPLPVQSWSRIYGQGGVREVRNKNKYDSVQETGVIKPKQTEMQVAHDNEE